ncbi:NUDIX domain-containing protein [Lihuaxuella thermophila]|nr:NUDIX domain-containing protein [Lihuaxuella thermophila]
MKVLVQCDMKESFYRFPGGSVEFSESAASAIQRECMEEYNLKIEVGELVAVAERLVEFDGQVHHSVTLFHKATLNDEDCKRECYRHKGYSHVQMLWKTFSESRKRPLYPEGILEHLQKGDNSVAHLVFGLYILRQ